MRLVYYVTGHGMGHAVRSATLIRALLEALPELQVVVRTAAPASALEEALGDRGSVEESALDPGAAEEDPLTIDPERTMEQVREVFARRNELLEGEVAALRRLEPELIAADAPFMAGYVAEAARVPCVAVTNFTWDWIYEPLFREQPGTRELLEWVRGGYRRMDLLLQLPFGGGEEHFRQVEPLSFLPRPAGCSREEVLARLGLGEDDTRTRVLPAMRGGTARELLERAAADASDFLFLWMETAEAAAENAMPVPAESGLLLPDLLQVADVVVSKPGWGILNDCITAGAALLWPPRAGFREDAVSTAEADRYIRHLSLPREEYHAGRWGAYLRELSTQPPPGESPPCDGVERAVALLSGRLARSGTG